MIARLEHLFDSPCVDALVACVRGGPMIGTSHSMVLLADQGPRGRVRAGATPLGDA